MEKIKQLGQYPTPAWAAEALVDRYFAKLSSHDLIIEPSCGPGAFLSAIPEAIPAIGVEIDADIAQLARHNTGRPVILGDFRTVALNVQPTAIIGNPPFDLSTIDGFLSRAHDLLPDGGQVGFILPSYAFQTAARVVGYLDQWSLIQEMIPRNIYPGLSLPLIFARFFKDKKRVMVGFALYEETTDIHQLAKPFREQLAASDGRAWANVIELALRRLGGEASLSEIYAVVSERRPTRTEFWREQIRKKVREGKQFLCTGKGRYKLQGFGDEKTIAMDGQQQRRLCF